MNNPFRHPDIYKLSAVLCGINLICLVVCLIYGIVAGIVFNGFFLIFNTITSVTNYYVRDQRIAEKKAHHRTALIELTNGK